ncbi:zinc finger CCCH domain-containing protein 55-like isoform X2 [Hibiscus syriacus]|uniref:Zinc finger CCCH domain-containing protein 55-like isoform X2 n=1 Tax=Hibiscus syriacus TaxID=106335 RepID=A0A6A3B2T3_HIBSY|nr:zinc finger CCCH domain-containing protein 55-like [Hibiscus syriacus]XP_038992863.1 zinc finger CCCH domain-containing protein 55-like [Hibiscus syriacus]KAE8711344.1 zinc finger CCCH domain-containing protein 55-like isoform X2 [Hibiscus syriacus]
MDLSDTTNVLFSKIKVLEPENASKIMGFILIQDLADRDLLRLAFGPETLLQSLVFKAKAQLGLSSSSFLTHLNPISRPYTSNNSQNPLPPLSPTMIPKNGLSVFSKKVPSWSPNGSPQSSPFLSYENIRSGSLLVTPRTGDSNTDLIDESQMSDYFSFLNDSSSSKNEDFIGHRRSFSESDACFGTAEEADRFGGLVGGYKPCLYFARGFCKNGDNCKFTHGLGGLADNVDINGGVVVGSPSKMDLLYHQHEEMMRMRAAVHQQRLAAAQLMAGVSSPLPYEKSMNLLLQHYTEDQRAAALVLGEEICKFSKGRSEVNDFLEMGLAEKAYSASKQIYLTFPSDSTFKDEDVSNYFSMFGPVQDVRIPYQQKRMFGFVTFVHPETVKHILARGNPHYICDSRVLVKPYKEKGKVPDKRQYLQQHLDRGNFSSCSSPSGLDSIEPYDPHVGAKMFHDAPEMMLRREFKEQADLQRAIELQRRRLVNLQLPDFKIDGIHHHQRSLSVDASVSLPAYSLDSQNAPPSDSIKQEVSKVYGGNTAAAVPITSNAAEEEEVNSTCVQKGGVGNPKGCHESCIEHALPDSPFASPEKSTESHLSEFPALVEVNGNSNLCAVSSSENDTLLLISSASGMSSI